MVVLASMVRMDLADWLLGACQMGTFVVLVYALARGLKGSLGERIEARSVRRVIGAGVAAMILCLAGVAMGAVDSARNLAVLGVRVTPRDQAFAVHRGVEDAWTGVACLALCVAAAGGLLLVDRGRARWAAAVAAGMAFLMATSVFARGRGVGIRRWDPPPMREEWIPEEARITISGDLGPPAWMTLALPVRILLVPAGIVVLLGVISLVRSMARRRPWPCPPTDPLLLVGEAEAVCVGVLVACSDLLLRTDVLVRLGRKAPPPTVLLDDLLHAAAPAVVILWIGVATVVLGLLARGRPRA